MRGSRCTRRVWPGGGRWAEARMGRALDVAPSEVGADGLGPLLAGPCAAPGRWFQVRPISLREASRAGGWGAPSRGSPDAVLPHLSPERRVRAWRGGHGPRANPGPCLRSSRLGFPRDPLGSWGDAALLRGLQAPASALCVNRTSVRAH